MAHALGGEISHGQILAPGPGHSHRDRSLAVRLDEAAPGGFLTHSFAGDDAIACRDHVRQKLSLPEWESQKRRGGRIVATYDYLDEAGALVSQVCRLQPKAFRQRRPDGAGGWEWKVRGVRVVPYHLPQLVEAITAGRPVFIVEGEKDADALALLGLAATCNAGGAGKWRRAHAECLRGADVIILPDNDGPGREHAESVAASLAGIAARVRVLALPGLLEKGDVSDWLAAGGGVTTLRELVEVEAQDRRPSEYIASSEPATPALDGSRINAPKLLEAVSAFIRRYAVYPGEHAYTAVTLWIAHAHRMDAWDNTPRLLFTSHQPASGKSRSLELVELLVPRPTPAFNVSAAYLVRKVVASPAALPTILYDEIDALFGGGRVSERTEDVRAVINAGHRRGATIGRCRTGDEGEIVTEDLPAYCAMALAGLDRRLPDTVTTRAIIVTVKRRARGECVQPLRRRLVESEARILREGLAAWMATIASTFPELPAEVTDRDADVWEAPITVADAAGGDWPERARAAARHFVEQRKAARPTLDVQLLRDIKGAFDATVTPTQPTPAEQLSTVQLLGALTTMDESPWGDIKGKPLDERGLARRLRPFDVRPRVIRIGTTTPRGYRREDFHDAWSRYA